MNIIARICADYRLAGWCLVVLLSIPPVLGLLGIRIADEVVDGWVPPSVLQELLDVEQTFHVSSSLILVLECDDFFQPDRISALHATVAALRTMDTVHHLAWLGDIPSVNLRGRQKLLLPGADEVLTEERLREAKTVLTDHPLSRQNLISADGRTILMLIDAREPDHVPAIRDAARAGLESEGMRVRATGVLALREVEDRILKEDNVRIQIPAYLLVGITAFVIFRRPAAMLIAGCGPMFGLFWSIGWLLLAGQAGNELAIIILPVMVVMIGYTDGVHLVVRIRQLRAAGANARDAVYRAVREVGPACLLTSVTTAIGFGSLMVSHSDMIAGFGRVSAIGVSVTFLAVVLVNPLLANSGLGERIHVDTSGDLLHRLMNRGMFVVEFVSRHARLVAASGVLVTVLCGLAAASLVPGDRLSSRVPQKSEALEAMRHCDSEFGGVRSVNLLIHWAEDTSRKEVWSTIQSCEQILEDEGVSSVSSIRTALTVFGVPNARDRSVLVSRLPDHLRERFYRKDLASTLVAGRLKDKDVDTFEPVFDRIEARLERLAAEHPDIDVKLVSDIIIESNVVRQIIEELMESLAAAAFIIFGVLAIWFRSLRIGLISIVPNIMPLAIAASIRLLINDTLGIASACSFAICLGIAVDDTIHYLTHFQRERDRGCSAIEANRRTFVSVGSALLMTTVVMTAGLATVLISRLPPHVNFAAMACSTLAAALPADLIVLPALLCLFPGRMAAKAAELPEPSATGEAAAVAPVRGLASVD